MFLPATIAAANRLAHLRPRRLAASHLLLIVTTLVGLSANGVALGQDVPASGTTAAAQPTTESAADSQPTTQSQEPRTPAKLYGAWVLVPPIVTIVLAIALRQVIPALAVGIVVAAYMMWPCVPALERPAGGAVMGGLRIAVETYVIGAMADVDHAKIILFTLLIGGMVGIIAANGGTAAIVRSIARWASDRRRGQLATWFAGLIVFFDDYANAMIVGPSMRPICDRLKISRAKLAYLVDSTAAPVASIALVGTWIGAEISYIQEGLDKLSAAPAFLEGMTAYRAFLGSIPYRFYAILALVMVLLIGLLNRDFGPMRRAEQDAQAPSRDADASVDASLPQVRGRAWYAGVPVLVLVFVTLGLLVATGWPAGGLASVQTDPEAPRWIGVMAEILYNCDSHDSILYGALAAMMIAVAISLVTRALTLSKTVDSATAVMARMLPTIIVLVLAWSLSAAMLGLQLDEVARTRLQEANFDAVWLPLLVFVTACIVSFATGTSWGTMGILCPAVVTISAGLLADTPAENALPLFYASVGAVLAGAVFGDHCSPISDTTVLSSLASECSLETHVWTQMPYALVVAIVSTLCGDVLCRYFEQPWWVGLLTGTAALLVIVLVLGRRPRPQSLPVQESTVP